MLIDAVQIPDLVRHANATIPEETKMEAKIALEKAEAEGHKNNPEYAEYWIDRLSLFCSEFVA